VEETFGKICQPEDNMKIDVKYVARLARLELTEEEGGKFAKQLANILEYMNKLNEVNTDGIEPTSHVLKLKNVWREDESRQSGSVEDIINNAPENEGKYFKVKKVIE
jgi:aspartyl-tRNA(Asn)/glutamyl-tRNA(Gln) amidotransferase subunit C